MSKICADQTRAQFSQTDADSQSLQSVNPAQFLCKSCAEHTLSRICAGLSHTQLDKSTPCAKSARSSLSPGCVSPAGRRRASLVCPSPPPIQHIRIRNFWRLPCASRAGPRRTKPMLGTYARTVAKRQGHGTAARALPSV